MAEVLNTICDSQQEKIEKSFKENLDRYIGSNAHTAMAADLRTSRADALTKRQKS